MRLSNRHKKKEMYSNIQFFSGCQCNPEGSVDQNCDSSTSQCQCKSLAIEGRSCDTCKDGYFGFPECQPCQCNGHSVTCDKDSGVCSDCSNGRIGDHCEK